MIQTILAEIDGNNILTIGSGAIIAIGGMAAAVIKAFRVGVNKGERQRNVTVDGQPIGVRVTQEFVTRTEFAEFKGELKADVREMRGSFDRLATLIDERDRKLSDMIEKVAAGAYEGRRRLHEEVNRHREQISAIGVNTDVSKNIGKLGAAIMTHLKNCPVARTNPTQS